MPRPAFQERDATSYNGFLHVAALRAAVALEEVVLGRQAAGERAGDANFTAELRRAIVHGEAALDLLLWSNGTGATGGGGANGSGACGGAYYAAAWDSATSKTAEQRLAPRPLLTDSLYGSLWAAHLGLDFGLDGNGSRRERLRAHLCAERALQSTPFGLRVWHPPDLTRPDRGDAMVWNGGSFSHAALALHLGARWGGPGTEPAAKVIRNYKHTLRDWWDWKDLNHLGGEGGGGDGYTCATAPAAGGGGGGGGSAGAPWCNSHYTRQLIGWTVPAALSGQRFDRTRRLLRFAPAPGAPRALPVFTADFTGTLDLGDDTRGRGRGAGYTAGAVGGAAGAAGAGGTGGVGRSRPTLTVRSGSLGAGIAVKLLLARPAAGAGAAAAAAAAARAAEVVDVDVVCARGGGSWCRSS
jgi:hypothetical protein